MPFARSAFVGAALLTFTSAAQAATVINFETFAPGTTITNQYAGQGVLFSSDGVPGTPPEISASYGSGRVLADLVRDINVPGTTFNIRADFTSLASNIAADVTTATGKSVIASIYDTGGALLNTITTGPQTLGVYETLILGGTDVSYAIFTTDRPTSAASIIDNLTFETAAVPLPASLPLLLAGLGGLIAARRRKAA